MAKRVFELAKELSVKSKAIVEKCEAEGIPNIVNHMSSISAGLEATIREWFTEGVSKTAVETAAPVDIDAVRAPAKAKARARPKAASSTNDNDDADSGSTATALAEPPQAPPVARAPAAPEPAPEDQPDRGQEPIHHTTQPAPEEARRVARAEPGTHTPPPTPGDTGDHPRAIARPASTPPATGRPAAPAAPQKPSPRVNVPRRPTTVSPAGPQLQVQQPVKLSGPKIIRVETPDVIEAPRRRTPAGEGGMPISRGPRGGAGVGVPSTEDDAQRGGRNPRVNNKTAKPGSPPQRGAARRSGRAETGDFNWREQDMIEREARLSRSEGFLRQRRREQKVKEHSHSQRATTAAETGGAVRVTSPLTIKDLSAATGIRAADIVKKLFMKGIPATVNSGIDAAQAQEIMLDYEIELVVVEAKSAEQQVIEQFAERERLDERHRIPVVTILGHVDHGKTSLLDKIRNTNVAAGEAGGITQSTRAFRTPVHMGDEDKAICFLDTPGHQAFSEMRARGANMTDIVVLVVSAADGVMPQTIESINHAKAAGVPVVVALNKIDIPSVTDSAIQAILGRLAEHELNPVEWGGATEVVRTSAISGQGIQELLETLDYQAQLLDLKADFKGASQGTVIEARIEEGRGAVANLLVREGCLKVGDVIVAGRAFGRVRDIIDDRGQKLKEAFPSTPVIVSGLSEVPTAGDAFFIVDSLRQAQEAAEMRLQQERERELATPKVTLDSMFAQLKEGDLKELLVVLKADVQGSVDVIRRSVEDISTDDVKVRVLHAAVGGITESDVTLAAASGAVILGFNVIPSGKARSQAEQKKVEIRSYQVIYDIVDDMKKAAEGLLEPELRQEVLGHAEVRAVFKVSKVGAIAGCYITDGTIERNALIRVTRSGIVVENDRVLEQLKRFKDDVKEVRAGQECGMKIVGYDDIKEGDVIECYRKIEVRRTLGSSSERSRG